MFIYLVMSDSFPTPWILHHLPELTQTRAHWVSDAIWASNPLSFSSPSAFNLSQHQGLFQWVGSLYQVDKVLKLQLQQHPSNECSGLISFRMDSWSSLQSSGLSRVFSSTTVQRHQFLQCTAFLLAQLSHPYMTTGKTIGLTRRTFVGKGMSLLFNMLSRFVIAFLPRGKCLLIWWLQSLSAVILGSPQNKVSHCFYYFPIYLPWRDGTRCHDLLFLIVEF